MERKFSSGLWVFANSIDKYGGYTESLSVKDQIKAASSVKGLKGVELIAPLHVNLDTVAEVRAMLEDADLEVVAVNPYLWTEPIWQRGALTSPDPKVRQAAVSTGKRAVDIARLFGAKKMCLWPGEDGWDYHFQADYSFLWEATADGVRQIAEYGDDIQIGIEFKMKEPRTHMLVGTAAKAALLGVELGLPNVGAYLDFGHALMANENPAETVSLLARHNRLVGVHVNDNYGAGDDDVIVGSVHFWAILEFLYALECVGYDDWISLDIVPTRENIVEACQQSITNLNNYYRLLEKLDRQALQKAQSEMDAIQAQAIVQAMLIQA